MSDPIELLPCPCCGGKAEVQEFKYPKESSDFAVRCKRKSLRSNLR
jgi:hypothetical protein